jgi:hypothetical protein
MIFHAGQPTPPLAGQQPLHIRLQPDHWLLHKAM